ncbi:MAG: tRNA (guanosine(46)-N7)-methyltransferase TrmB [Gammaproteobacteria bacterium]|nr:tRNA (guanosine(46)-N7)-methyltransferase TrmB [Gammaproteobacteria bacterium]
MMTEKYIRTIRSFVKREGRLTSSQQYALDNYWADLGIDYSENLIDFETLFGRSAETVLEIGFGNGESLWQMANNHADKNYIGIEVHRPGVGRLLHLVHTSGITNLRLSNHDAIDVLKHQIADQSLDRVQLYFPDPWHKKKHHKRRIVQPDFVHLIAQKLKSGGIFHLATDWENYALQMKDVLNASDEFTNLSSDNTFVVKPEERPTTKFEHRGHRLGHGVWDLLYERK